MKRFWMKWVYRRNWLEAQNKNSFQLWWKQHLQRRAIDNTLTFGSLVPNQSADDLLIHIWLGFLAGGVWKCKRCVVVATSSLLRSPHCCSHCSPGNMGVPSGNAVHCLLTISSQTTISPRRAIWVCPLGIQYIYIVLTCWIFALSPWVFHG